MFKDIALAMADNIGHTLNLSAIKSPYYISASFKYACSKLVCMNMPGFKNALNRYIFTIIFYTVILLRKVDLRIYFQTSEPGSYIIDFFAHYELH